MKKWFNGLLIASMSFTFALAAPQDAVTQIKGNIQQVQAIISKDNGSNTTQLRKQAENYAIPFFDFQRMTALAVGQSWKQATTAQKAALTNEFKTLLIRTYSGTMIQYKKAKVTVKDNPKSSGSAYIVSSEVNTGSGKPVVMDYTVYPSGSKYLVYNISVEGASLVTVYRNQFNEIIQKNGIDGLVQELKNKNARGSK